MPKIHPRHYARRRIFAVIVTVFALTLTLSTTGSAFAAGFGIEPVTVVLTKDTTIGQFTITNTKSDPAVFEVQAFHWTQNNGKDILDPTKDMLLAPSVFTVPVLGRQIFRVALRQPGGPPVREDAYRLYITEVPSRVAISGIGIRVAQRFNVPVFVAPAAVEGSAAVSIVRVGEKRVRLVVTNNATTHLLIHKLQIRSGGVVVYAGGIDGYILPGNATTWTVDLSQPLRGHDAEIDLTDDQGEKHLSVTVSP